MELICTSHSPLLLSVMPEDRRAADAFFAALDRLHDEIVAYDPELVVIFAPDHFNGFFYDVMPSFCIGFTAAGTTDWDIEAGMLAVPTEAARALADAVRAQGFDVAISRRMIVDHGFTIPLALLMKRLDAFPTIPIFVNCNAPPLPSCARTRAFGASVGHYLRSMGKRVLIIGSGGISHDPPHAPFEEAPPAMQELLLATTDWTAEHEQARQQRVKTAALELVAGGGPCRPPNQIFDRNFLDTLLAGRLEAVDHYTDDWIQREGGGGAQEIRNWIAAFAALAAAGPYRAEERFYAIIPDWITGMAVLRATA